jgi:uncharacterized protein (DUF427 family)
MSDQGRVSVERTRKRVRAILGGETIVDSSSVLMVWEIPFYPSYYFPEADVGVGALGESGVTMRSPRRGNATWYQV